MKRKIGIFLTVIIILLIIGTVLWRSGPSSRNAECIDDRPLLSPHIDTALPRRQDFPVVRQWFGRVESKKKVKIISLYGGQVISVDAGDEGPVKKGASLFTLGGAQVSARMTVLQKKVSSLRERVALARGLTAIKQAAVSERLARQEELSAAEDQATRLRAELEDSEQELRIFKTAIHIQAPIDGSFTGRAVSPGQVVQSGDVLAEVIDTAHVRVVASLFAPEFVHPEGRKALIDAPDAGRLSGWVVKALSRHSPEGAMRIWIEGPDLDRCLKPGEMVGGQIVILIHKKALSIPQGAVIRDAQNQACVFVKTPDGFRKKPVKTGCLSDGRVEITSGVNDNDPVVVQGAYELFYRNFNRIFTAED